MAAAYRGHAPCVAILVMKGADAHQQPRTGPGKTGTASGSPRQGGAKSYETGGARGRPRGSRNLGVARRHRGRHRRRRRRRPQNHQKHKRPAPTAATPLRRCSRCKKVWYCSVLCQQEHYKKGHRSKCWAAKGGRRRRCSSRRSRRRRLLFEDDFSALPPHRSRGGAGERAGAEGFDKGGGVEAAATAAGRAASLAAMARGLSITDAAAASRDARAAVTGD